MLGLASLARKNSAADSAACSVVVPAGSMIHYLRTDRSEQSRGIPEITPALPLFAQLRRYTLAVIAAAIAAIAVLALAEVRRLLPG